MSQKILSSGRHEGKSLVDVLNMAQVLATQYQCVPNKR